jgi:hypothetical protein
MRSIGIASRALDLMMERVSDPIRKTFGKELREHGTVLSDIARSRAEIDQARLLVLSAARKVDTHGAKAAMKEIGIAKVCPLFSLISFNFFPYHSRILFFLSFPPNLRCSLRSSSSLLSDPSPSLFSSSQSSEATVKAWTNTQFSVPEMALKVVDRAIQVHGAEGISQDQPLAYFWASLRTLKFADVSLILLFSSLWKGFLAETDMQGPDEVHIQQQGKQELKRVPMLRERYGRIREKSARLANDPERAKL